MSAKNEIEQMLDDTAETIHAWDGRRFVLDSDWDDGQLVIMFHEMESPEMGQYAVSAIRHIASKAEEILNRYHDPVTESRWEAHKALQCECDGKPCNEFDDRIDSVRMRLSRQYE